jgi:hypothetical protein
MEGNNAKEGHGRRRRGWAQSQRAQRGMRGCWVDGGEQARPRANASNVFWIFKFIAN